MLVERPAMNWSASLKRRQSARLSALPAYNETNNPASQQDRSVRLPVKKTALSNEAVFFCLSAVLSAAASLRRNAGEPQSRCGTN
jgi:phage portal protein BeeE